MDLALPAQHQLLDRATFLIERRALIEWCSSGLDVRPLPNNQRLGLYFEIMNYILIHRS